MSKFELLPLEIVAVVIGEIEVVRPPQGTAENSQVINPPLPLDERQKNETIFKKQKYFCNKILSCLLHNRLYP